MSKGAISLNLKGDKELVAALKSIGDVTFRKVMRSATNAAMQPVLRSARSNAASIGRHHTIAKSLIKKTKTYPRNNVVVTLVGPDKDYVGENGHRPVKTAHLVELGTAAHVTRTTEQGLVVTHPGTPPRPFLRPALENNRTGVENALIKKVKERVPIEMARLAKRKV